jgi:fatty-acid desaturase
MTLPASLASHRVSSADLDSVRLGSVAYSPGKSLWFLGMVAGAIAGVFFFTWGAFLLFLAVTGCVLLFGHSLGSHRKLIHGSYGCPKWLEYALVYCGVQVGLAGPLGLMRQHELRDYAQRLPDCHDYLRHGQPFWIDAWWQLNCELRLARPPALCIEPRVGEDRFYRFLERTWMAQQLPWAVLLYVWGGWGFVFWGTCARVTAGVFGHWLIGYFAHNHGPMHYRVDAAAVQGHNVRFTSLITMGESWHNNHHAFPGSARLGLYPGEWDPGWWVLVLLRRVGLVWDIRLAEHLPPRAELVHLAPPPTRREAPRGPMLEWPASVMPAWAMRSLLGRRIELRLDRTVPRLTFHEGGRVTYGIRGLYRAFAHGMIDPCLR